MIDIEPAVRIRLEPTNPGQFFACCGLFELAHRLWQGAEGWFEDSVRAFCIAPMESAAGHDATGLMRSLAACKLTNTMTSAQFQRRELLGQKKEKELSAQEKDEKKKLDGLWREMPLFFPEPFCLRVDWFTDTRAGGSRYKTWAGQQSVIDIARAMHKPISDGEWANVPSSQWLAQSGGEGVPFNFDSDVGGQSSALDIGFSLDPLDMKVRIRPLIELAVLIGLQRFRPFSESSENRHTYAAWTVPLLPAAAALAVTGLLGKTTGPKYEFRLLYRTKYLKSFLPATRIQGDQ
jgi:CRISPR-associated protein Csb3